jgi:NDP-sugar pyrophosphorylase family protein
MLPIAILAGGLATRLGGITKNTPKSMIVINGKPFIHWQLELLAKHKITEVVLCVAHFSEQIVDFVGDGSRWGVNVKYSEDGHSKLGTGGALLKALPLLNENFGVLYGDSFLLADYKEISNAFIKFNTRCLMTVFKNSGLNEKSNIHFFDKKIVSYDKNDSNMDMQYIDFGLLYFNKSAFLEKDFGPSFDISLLLRYMISLGHVDGLEVYNRYYQIGSLLGIKELSEFLKGGV